MRKRLIFKRRERFFVIRELKSVGSKLTLRQQEASVESPEVGIRQIVTAAESKIQPGSFIEGHADDLFPGGGLKSAEPSKIKSSAESELAALLSPNL